jgi:hypothetical protein
MWAGGVAGTIVFLACLAVATSSVYSLTLVEQDAAEAYIAIGIAIPVGLLFGLGLVYVAARVYAKVVIALFSLYLMTAGFLAVVTAPALRQMNTPELAEHTAFTVLTWSGSIAMVAGVALAALCVRWASRRHAARRLRRWFRIAASAYGVFLGLAGLAAALAFLGLIRGGSADSTIVQEAIAVTVIVGMLLIPGLILTYQGISASMGEGSTPFRPPVVALALVAYAAVLVIGGLIMRADTPVAAPMPPLHMLAAALPGITLLGLAARGALLRGEPVPWLTWRQVMVAASVSMTLGVAIALYVEGLGIFGVGMLLLVQSGAFEFADSVGAVLEDAVETPDLWLSENQQFVANVAAAVVLAPLVEEAAKPIGVAVMLTAITTRAQAFTMGAAAGAAFGFFEALGYGLAVVQDDISAWWEIMLVRGGSTSLHVFATGLVGLALWYWMRQSRRDVALKLFGAAVLLHALWNGIAVILYSRIFILDTLSLRAVEVIGYATLVPITLACIVGVGVLARRLREPRPRPVEATPLASMSPWMG